MNTEENLTSKLFVRNQITIIKPRDNLVEIQVVNKTCAYSGGIKVKSKICNRFGLPLQD